MARRSTQPPPPDDPPPHGDEHAPGAPGAPGAHGTPNQGDQNPFLKVADVYDNDVFTLSGWVRRTEGRFGPQIILEVTQNRTGNMFDFGIGVGSPNHRVLFKRMGPDEFKWKGSIVVSVRQGDKANARPFISIDQVNADNPPF